MAAEIEVLPSKALFVEMLTKDIALDKAILDLVDNSLDGARKLKGDSGASLDGLQISVKVNADRFEISDNCGGFSIEHAKNYAFRLGRPKKAPTVKGSIGRFGIGMKRAFFKIGRKIELTSTTANEYFKVIIDVDKWLEDENEWHFSFAETKTGQNNSTDATGTVIKITELTEETAINFGQEKFINALSAEIRNAQSTYLGRGITILYNGIALIAAPWEIIEGDGFSPYSNSFDYPSNGSVIKVRILAGVGPSAPTKAGWYIFCNGRMVVEADQSRLTTWVGKSQDEEFPLPKYHNQFSKFRGYVSFDSEDPDALPWNTTKTSVDVDSAVYNHTRQKMFKAARPVIDFLNKLDAENDADEEERPLMKAIEAAKTKSITEDFSEGSFQTPTPKPTPKGPKQVSISYKKPFEEVEALKEALNARSNRELGEMSFDIAMETQGLE